MARIVTVRKDRAGVDADGGEPCPQATRQVRRVEPRWRASSPVPIGLACGRGGAARVLGHEACPPLEPGWQRIVRPERRAGVEGTAGGRWSQGRGLVVPPRSPTASSHRIRMRPHGCGTQTGGRPLVLGVTRGVSSAAWARRQAIVTASGDKTARVWNATGGRAAGLKGHEGSSAAWSPDGKRIVTASDDKTARVWNADGRARRWSSRATRTGLAAAWSPDAAHRPASDDKTARVGTQTAGRRGSSGPRAVVRRVEPRRQPSSPHP